MLPLPQKDAGENVRYSLNRKQDSHEEINPAEDGKQFLDREYCAILALPYIGMGDDPSYEKEMQEQKGNPAESQTAQHKMKHRQQFDMLGILPSLIFSGK